MARGQYAAGILLSDIDRLVFRCLPFCYAAVQHAQLNVWIHSQEEWQGVTSLACLVAYAMHGGGELAVALPLKVLANIADKSVRLWFSIDPDAVLIQNF